MNGKLQDLALWRHHEAAIEAAAFLLAIARCRVTDREPAIGFVERQRLQAIDLLHEFSYNARRAIELAEAHDKGIIAQATKLSVRPPNRPNVQLAIEDDEHELADESLWWVLGRIIHSQELRIHYREEAEVGTEWAAAPSITEYQTAVAFAVRSHYDGADARHFVLIEELLCSFLQLRERIAAACQVMGFPMDTKSMFL